MANELVNELQVTGQQIVDQMRKQLAVNRANATGNLSNSIKSEVVTENNNVTTLSIEMDDYGPILDKGRGRTYRPNTSAGQFFANLKSWVGLKLGLSGKNQIRATVAIFKKINKRGYRAKPFIDKSIQVVLKRNERNLSDAAFRVLVNQVDQAFLNIQKKLK